MFLTNKKISSVVICYLDEPAISIMYERLTKTLQKITPNYEIIWVNDGSPGNAEDILRDLAAKDQRVTVINHARNFSTCNAFVSGMAQATGDAVSVMDGDLQDPPELIENFVKKWLEGYDAVYGVRVKREAPLFMQFAYKAFYRVFRKLSYLKIPLDASDFSLMDRKVVNAIVALPERDILLRGLRAWVGFKQTGVDYFRPERMFGHSTNNFWKNVRWAKKGIFSFSFRPLEWIFYLALLTVILAFIGIIIHVVLYFTTPDIPRGFSTVIVLVLFMGGIQLVCLSIIAEYLGKIFEETKGRPKYIVKNILNDHRKENKLGQQEPSKTI